MCVGVACRIGIRREKMSCAVVLLANDVRLLRPLSARALAICAAINVKALIVACAGLVMSCHLPTFCGVARCVFMLGGTFWPTK